MAAEIKAGEGNASVSDLTFEAALEELEEIVERLEAGSVDLEKSVDLYDRGVKLNTHCQKKIEAVRKRAEQAAGGGLETMSSTDDNDFPTKEEIQSYLDDRKLDGYDGKSEESFGDGTYWDSGENPYSDGWDQLF